MSDNFATLLNNGLVSPTFSETPPADAMVGALVRRRSIWDSLEGKGGEEDDQEQFIDAVER